MSHPDPRHDAENERADDDLLRDEIDARRREDAQAAYAEAMGRRDRDAVHYGTSTPDAGWLYGAGDRPSNLIWPDKEKERK